MGGDGGGGAGEDVTHGFEGGCAVGMGRLHEGAGGRETTGEGAGGGGVSPGCGRPGGGGGDGGGFVGYGTRGGRWPREKAKRLAGRGTTQRQM